jgi:hypothetical protein
MNYVRMGQVGLGGWRGKVAGTVATPLAERSRFDEDEIMAIIGAAFLALSLWQSIKLVRSVLEAGREIERAG